MDFNKVEKDIKKIKETYGDIDVDIKDGYYVCTFNNSLGTFQFLETFEDPGKPHALRFELGFDPDRYKKTVQAIKKLQEI